MAKNFNTTDSVEGFNEDRLLQSLHQNIEFNPKQIFSFDNKFIIGAILFAISYDITFIQFYAY